MRTIETIRVATPAIAILRRELESCKPNEGGVIALVFLAGFANKDGSPVDGFAPGYMVVPMERRYLYDHWIHARPLGLPEFHIDLRTEWNGLDGLVIDLAATTYAIFSIAPDRQVQP